MSNEYGQIERGTTIILYIFELPCQIVQWNKRYP